jgi:hypothetical protein
MKRVVEAVLNKEMGLLRASKTSDLPRSTIKDYVKIYGRNTVEALIGKKPVLPTEAEEELVRYCLVMEHEYYGLCAKDVKRVAYSLAVRNGARHPFSREKETEWRKWLKLFLRRHHNLSFRKPQRVSAARIHGFTQENVDNFFSILEPEMVNIKFFPNRIFNLDETGITIVQHKSIKVVCVKGKRQVASLSSAERDALVMVVTCMSAFGQFVPPFADLPQEEYEIRVAGWRTSWNDWYLSHLWLDPDTVIYAVVQAFCFYCQTYD